LPKTSEHPLDFTVENLPTNENMASSNPLIKQIAAGRRKPDMTRKEYFDHRFRVHGALSDAPEDKDWKPQ
jgi:hypothetical protein